MEVRINKFLSEAGVCSRREADRQIEAGNVTIGGKTARMGDQVSDGQEVCFCGRPVQKEKEMILIALNKPAGIVCTAEKREKNNVIDFLHYPKRIYPVGRLDKESEGLLLLTNNGEIVNKIMRSGNMHEKEYLVTVNRPVTDAFLHGKRCSACGTWHDNAQMQGRTDRKKTVPDHSDTGIKPTDPTHV